MEVMVPERRSLMMAMAIGSIPATGMGKNKADGNCQWEEQPSTYKRKKTNADHDSSYNNVMPPSGNAWNAGDGIERPNAKSNAGSSQANKITSSLHKAVQLQETGRTYKSTSAKEMTGRQ
ncbi:unnamed protein product [Miscanthus lutarioriparius]|uniref:Uncharacterized protein n=1 Tax=Miscanthus lutarioriparius TaxID=422564 RepID=A0A811RKP5_9POAL|nr:unnamed protein product [Miscanthus lutarioriparius]